jgi:acyl-CoA thioesterase II
MSTAPNPHDFDDLFALQPAGPGRFVAVPPGEGFLFGGLTMALMLQAAVATVREGMVAKSLHALFLNSGLWGPPPIDLNVETAADSRAFSSRRVAVDQLGRRLVDGVVSFHSYEEGEDWQVTAPDVAPPEALESRPMTFASGSQPAEIRLVVESAPGFSEIIHPFWGRSLQPASDGDPMRRYGPVLFLTDYLVIATPFPRASGAGQGKMSRTLEHSIWFHRPVLDDDWLLYSCDATSVVGGRYFSQGTVHDRAGRLIATFAQLGMIRPAPVP